MFLNRDKATARRFPYVIILERHPEHPFGMKGDPRKSWLYEGFVSSAWRVTPVDGGFGVFSGPFSYDTDKRVNSAAQYEYMFSNECDALLFQLKWM